MVQQYFEEHKRLGLGQSQKQIESRSIQFVHLSFRWSPTLETDSLVWIRVKTMSKVSTSDNENKG